MGLQVIKKRSGGINELYHTSIQSQPNRIAEKKKKSPAKGSRLQD